MSKTGADWDRVYLEPGYAFGTEPNDFLVQMAEKIPPGQVLCLGEGEGRNAAYLASLGLSVTAMDYSPVGIQKAQDLAQQKGVQVEAVVADLEDYEMGQACWSAVVSIFVQVPPDLRARAFARAVDALKPGGVFICEAYARQQSELESGGPKQNAVLYDLEQVRQELAGLDLQVAQVTERELNQGRRNQGLSAVAQLFGVKP